MSSAEEENDGVHLIFSWRIYSALFVIILYNIVLILSYYLGVLYMKKSCNQSVNFYWIFLSSTRRKENTLYIKMAYKRNIKQNSFPFKLQRQQKENSFASSYRQQEERRRKRRKSLSSSCKSFP